MHHDLSIKELKASIRLLSIATGGDGHECELLTPAATLTDFANLAGRLIREYRRKKLNTIERELSDAFHTIL